MPPRLYSRHQFCTAFADPVTGKLVLTDREPYRFVALADNVQHTIVEGDSLARLAARYFAPLEDAAELWWIIADFQPEPIFDPTLVLEVGQTIVLPSLDTVMTEVFDEARRDL